MLEKINGGRKWTSAIHDAGRNSHEVSVPVDFTEFSDAIPLYFTITVKQINYQLCVYSYRSDYLLTYSSSNELAFPVCAFKVTEKS